MPQRRCVGCGRVAPKPTLARLALAPVAGPGRRTAVLDRAQHLPGRGAYVCRDAAGGGLSAPCLRQALRRGGLSRALRATVAIADELQFVESSP